jgi:hypothetical protein
MEFGIGFVTGGLLAGFAAAKSGTILKAAHGWLAKTELAAKQKMAAKAAAIETKL